MYHHVFHKKRNESIYETGDKLRGAGCVHVHTERELERKTHREKQRGDGIMEETENFRNVFYNASLDVFLRKHQYCLDAVLNQCGVQAITEQPWVLIIGKGKEIH